MTKFHICIKVCTFYCISLPALGWLSGHIMASSLLSQSYLTTYLLWILRTVAKTRPATVSAGKWLIKTFCVPLLRIFRCPDAKCCCSRSLQSLIIEWIVCTFANFISKQPSQAEKYNCHWIAAAGGRGRGAEELWPLAGSLKFWARSQWHCGPGREMHNFINYLQKMRTAVTNNYDNHHCQFAN